MPSQRTGEPYADGSGTASSDEFPSYPWGQEQQELDFMSGPGHPVRVLAEVDAKRRLIDLHEGDHECSTYWLLHRDALRSWLVSHVSSMIVTCELIEDGQSFGDGGLTAFHAWCENVDKPIRFAEIPDDLGVNHSKGIEVHVLVAAGNYFDHDALAEAFPTFPWSFPENAVLVVQPQDGRPIIVRGDGLRVIDYIETVDIGGTTPDVHRVASPRIRR